jgi:hypothetical protein
MPLDYKFFIDDYWVDVWGSKNVTNKIKQVFSDVLPFAATPCLMVVTATAAWDVRIRRLPSRRCQHPDSRHPYQWLVRLPGKLSNLGENLLNKVYRRIEFIPRDYVRSPIIWYNYIYYIQIIRIIGGVREEAVCPNIFRRCCFIFGCLWWRNTRIG